MIRTNKLYFCCKKRLFILFFPVKEQRNGDQGRVPAADCLGRGNRAPKRVRLQMIQRTLGVGMSRETCQGSAGRPCYLAPLGGSGLNG